jgi:hypothetical protein
MEGEKGGGAGRSPGQFSLLIASDYKGCRWGSLNFKMELGSWNQGTDLK